MADDFPFERGLTKNPFSPVDDLLKAGVAAYYEDPDFPELDLMVREDPDGTRTLIRFTGEVWQDVRAL